MSWWSLFKRELEVLNSPDELWEPAVGILKDSDWRCSSKEFQTLNLIASFASFTQGGVGIWGGYTGSWRKDTNLRKGMYPECLSWMLFWCTVWWTLQFVLGLTRIVGKKHKMTVAALVSRWNHLLARLPVLMHASFPQCVWLKQDPLWNLRKLKALT